MYSNRSIYLEHEASEFTQAIEKYIQRPRYKRCEKITSFLIVSLQVIALFNVLYTYETVSYLYIMITLFIAYIATDFINGLVHMYMDNNTRYSSIVGPFVAAFHLHHAKYIYRVRHPIKVYYDESGTKFWLLGYLIFFVSVQLTISLSTPLNLGCLAFGIFSSLAELSHYWCHNATANNKKVLWLQKHGILLSKEHHKAHHCSDNTHYAFLNGLTDPLINTIARYFYKGYKNHADKHTQMYLRALSNIGGASSNVVSTSSNP